MNYAVIKIDSAAITDWDTFHDAFSDACDFPDYYGRNMNAWIDCVSDIAAPFVLRIQEAASLRERCPEIYAAIVECSAFVNWRNIESKGDPIVFLAFGD